VPKTPRVIKKYPNRRLYDTEQSRYITLVDLQKLVLAGEDFEVVDANSGNDITRNILLQIISEQESGGRPLFTTDILLRIIRFYGASVQDAFSTYLEESLSLFEQQQQAFHEQFWEAVQHSPVTALSEMTQRNLELWQQIQDQFFANAGLKKPKKSKD
jgi:polyhydroxyalkanoate synthesis repressor PhaR